MTDPEHTPIMDPAEAQMLEALARDLAAMPGRLKRWREVEREAQAKATAARAAHHGELSAHRVAIDEADAAHRARCAERERALAGRESAVAEREREVEEKAQRAEAQMRMAEMRSADLGNRIRGAA